MLLHNIGCRILEGPVTDSAHLWVLARVMSRDEFEEALEERALADLPRNPLPDQDDDELTALARKLGNAAAAQERFDKLLHQMRAQRRGAGERAVLREPGPPPAADGATKVAGEARPDVRIVELEAPLAPLDATLDAARPGPVFDPSRVSPEASAPPPDRPPEVPRQPFKPALKPPAAPRPPTLAAGTEKKPIMLAQVQERPVGARREARAAAREQGLKISRPRPSLARSRAVEGFVPRERKPKDDQDAEQPLARSVRFADEEEKQGDVENASRSSRGSAPAVAPTGSQTSASGTPLAIFDVEDARSPLEGSAQGLPSLFGRLRLPEEEGEAGTAAPAALNAVRARLAAEVSSTAPSEALDLEAADAGTQRSIEALMNYGRASTGSPVPKEVLRGAVALAPRLRASLPPELERALEESEAESDDWQASDDDDDDGEMDALSAAYRDEEDEDEEEGQDAQPGTNPRLVRRREARSSAYQIKLTFFGQMHSHLEAWISPATLALLRLPPRAPEPALEPAPAETRRALGNVLAGVLPSTLRELAAQGARPEAERALGELLRTLRCRAALPPFRPAQWEVLVLVLLKAASMERAPGLRPLFETREGIQKLGLALGRRCFTIEEFYAVLDLLLEEDKA